MGQTVSVRRIRLPYKVDSGWAAWLLSIVFPQTRQMGKGASEKTKTVSVAAKQPAPTMDKKKKVAKAKATEAAADAIIAELTKVKPAKSSGKTSKKTTEAKEVKKVVAKKVKPVTKQKKKAGKDKGEVRDLHIPKEVRRRFLRRAGNVRVSDSVLGPLDEVGKETIDELMLNCVRAAVLAGREKQIHACDIERSRQRLRQCHKPRYQDDRGESSQQTNCCT